MREYTAEDGLRLLEHIEIKGLTPRERQEFRLQWDKQYKGCDSDPILATAVLYISKLTYNCHNQKEVASLYSFRIAEFMEKACEKNIGFLARSGFTLDEILDEDADEAVN